MKAFVQTGFGASDVLSLVDIPEPRPEPDDVVVQVAAAALNRLDVLQRKGPALLPGFTLPHIAGMDIAGTVVEVGPAAVGVELGHRVLVNPSIECGVCPACLAGDDAFCPNKQVVGANAPGGFAERVVVPHTHVHRIPDTMSFTEACTIPTIHSTAWGALVETGDLRVGEWMLVHAAGSGVSTAAIQLAQRMGARVIATAGTEPKLELALALGAEFAVSNRDPGWIDAVRAVTGGRGVDMVFDHVGPALFDASIQCLRPRGRLVFCGTTTGAMATFSLPYAYQFGLRLLGSDTYSRAEFARMLESYWVSDFTAVVDVELPLADLPDAQDRLDANDVIGKIVLHP
ncbi:MAG: alcohol dehydrogenase [Actinomycetia bacterium]|nr:alcohol dehydrogenase [Actinomycetes bacterium]